MPDSDSWAPCAEALDVPLGAFFRGGKPQKIHYELQPGKYRLRIWSMSPVLSVLGYHSAAVTVTVPGQDEQAVEIKATGKRYNVTFSVNGDLPKQVEIHAASTTLLKKIDVSMVLYEKVQKMKWVTHWEASDPSAGLGEAGDTVTIDNQAPYRVTCGLALPGRWRFQIMCPDILVGRGPRWLKARIRLVKDGRLVGDAAEVSCDHPNQTFEHVFDVRDVPARAEIEVKAGNQVVAGLLFKAALAHLEPVVDKRLVSASGDTLGDLLRSASELSLRSSGADASEVLYLHWQQQGVGMGQPALELSCAGFLLSGQSACPKGTIALPAVHPNCYVIGRTKNRGGKYLEYDWSGVTAHAKFRGTKEVWVLLNGGKGYFNVFVNDIHRLVLRTKENVQYYRLVSGLDEAVTYEIRLVKRSEPVMKGAIAKYTPVELHAFLICEAGEFLPTAPSEPTTLRRIEFVGDSDSNGFGVLGPKSSASSLNIDSSAQDVTYAWTWATASAFNAECHIMAWTGKAVASNPYFMGKETMADLYPRTMASSSEQYDFNAAQWHPQLVVIYLGSNDYVLAPFPSEAQFALRYAELITKAREFHPAAKVLAVTMAGPAIASTESAEQQLEVEHSVRAGVRKALAGFHVVCTADGTAGVNPEGKVYYRHLDPGPLDESDWAMLMHWSPTGHKKVAAVAVRAIAEIMQWTSLPPAFDTAGTTPATD